MQKVHISLIYAVLFAVLSLPIVYKLTNLIISGLVDENGYPTIFGILVHALVFLIISVLLMYIGK